MPMATCTREKVADVFSRQALPMVWDHAEPESIWWSMGQEVGMKLFEYVY
jgi:adenine-specific DNA methylase